MNHLILANSFTLFLGTNPVPIKTHRHPSIQLVVGTEVPFRSKKPNGEWAKKRGLLIAPNHPHECDARDREILSVDKAACRSWSQRPPLGRCLYFSGSPPNTRMVYDRYRA